MQNKEFKIRSWFENKKCQYCGKQGTIFRLIKSRHLILCDSEICSYKCRIQAGFFNDQLNIKNKEIAWTV